MDKYAHFYQKSLNLPEEFWREQSLLIDWKTSPLEILNYQNPRLQNGFLGAPPIFVTTRWIDICQSRQIHPP